jgi:diguanylate cyclase (GGDEF)-like protein
MLKRGGRFRGKSSAMPQRHIPVQKRAPIKLMIAIGLAVTLSFSAICTFVILGMADRDYTQVQKSSENLAATLAANIGRNFEVLELSLQAVQDALKLDDFDKIDPDIRNMILFDRSTTAQDVGSLLVLDRHGDIKIESRASTPRKANFGHRDYFQHHQASTDTGTYISQPWVTNAGLHVLGISRRLNDANGDFNGVVVAILKLSYFHNLLKDIRISDNDNITVGRSDGTILLRMPFDIKAIGSDISSGRIFTELKRSPQGSFETVAVSDGVRRLVAYQKVGIWPVIVGVGRSIEDIYAPWRVEAWSLGLIVFALCALNLALVAFVVYSFKRRAAAEHELAVMATTDSLTGLCNRRRFDEVLDMEWRRAKRDDNSVALLLIDIDHFKKYNDQFGHQTGDRILAAIARCIAASTQRAGDVAARFGGEEFAVLLPGTSMQDAFDLAERIRKAVQALPVWEGGPKTTPTISIGIASAPPSAGLSHGDLVKASDAALYQAKAAGRNRSVQAPLCANPAVRRVA